MLRCAEHRIKDDYRTREEFRSTEKADNFTCQLERHGFPCSPSMTIRKLAALSLLVFSTIAANDVAPSNAELEAMYDRAFRAFDAVDYTQALKELDAIDARKPDLAASQNLRGVIYMRQGIYGKAEAALSESQRLDPKFWNARFNLAEIPFLKKDWASARKRFQELLSSNGADLQGEATQLIQYKILLTYLMEGNEAMVDSILAKFELSPDTPAVHYANAAIALQKQDIPDARNWMSTAEKNFTPQLNKLFAESLFEVGWLQQQPGQQRTALQLLSPEERASGNKAMAQSQLDQAQQAYEQRDFVRAAKLAEQADATQPDQPAVLNLRGEILLEQGKFSDAEQFFSKALKIDGKFREAQFNLADVPFRQKEYDKARERFQALLKQTPGGDKNQASQLINFKIFMTYLLQGKDSRAQGMIEQFQFSGDTPALYYAQAAWEFKHGKIDKANDWITSARKIYPLASNAAYGSGFYDLGWLTSGTSAAASPAPSAAVDAAAVASAQNESPAPSAVEPSPIPGVEAKTEESAFVSAQAQPSPAMANASPVATSTAEAQNQGTVASAGSPARPQDIPALPSTGISHVVEMPSASASPTASLPASAAPVNAPAIAQASAQNAASPAAASPAVSASPVVVAQTTPAASSAPAKGSQFVQPTPPERVNRLADPRTVLSIVLLAGGLGIIAWVGVLEVRRRMHAPNLGHRPAPVTGPDLHTASTEEKAPQAGQRFSGGPRQISVQLKASEPSLRRASVALTSAVTEPPAEIPVPVMEKEEAASVPVNAEPAEESLVTVIAQAPAEASVNGETAEVVARDETPSVPEVAEKEEEIAPAWEPSSRFADLGESVGPVIEQAPAEVPEPIPASMAADNEADFAETMADGEPAFDSVATHEVATPQEVVSETKPVMAEAEPEDMAAAFSLSSIRDEPAPEIADVEVRSEIEEMPLITEVAKDELADMPKSSSKKDKEPAPEREPVAQGQPVPYQTVVEKIDEAPAKEAPAEEAELLAVSGAIAGLGALRGAMPESKEEKEFPQPTTIQTMPETQTAPVIRTPAGSTQPSPTAPIAAAGGIHTAVHITLSCEIASMQLTPSFKMGALQLRPISKVVSMKLAPSQQQQQQNGMNFQVNFEIAKVQPAPGSLGQIRLSPSAQQKPATLNSPSFNISGLQVVSGFEQAPLQLTPSQQGQASVHLTAAFQITTVEFSPTFEIAAMILNSSAKTVSVQLPGAGGSAGDNGPLFEITNVQLSANGEISMLQLNPATTRRG
jgi:predicted Zn-dependent protease